ncbi:MAG: glycosyltransferase [Bacteroidota bacterium]
MIVLHLSTAKTWRGGEQQMIYLAEEMQKKQIQQIVFCIEKSKVAEICEQKSIPYRCFKKRTSLDIFAALKLANLCKNNEIDIIHTHDSHAHTTAVLSAVLFGNKSKIFVSRRVDFPVKKTWFSYFKYNHKSVVRIACVSEMINKITSKAIKDKSKLITIYSGIDLKKFDVSFDKDFLRKEFNLEKDTVIIGNTSAVAPHKDYFTFVDSAEKFIKKGISSKFFIAGNGPLQNEIKEYIESKGLSNDIILLGFRKDILQVLNGFDVFLITSKTEGLGTSILDAFASGVPVIATKAGGIPEIVVHEKTGLLAPIKDSNALANLLEQIINDKELKNRLVENATELLNSFTKENTANKTIGEYIKLYK